MIMDRDLRASVPSGTEPDANIIQVYLPAQSDMRKASLYFYD